MEDKQAVEKLQDVAKEIGFNINTLGVLLTVNLEPYSAESKNGEKSWPENS
jgi:hypothetical protein